VLRVLVEHAPQTVTWDEFVEEVWEGWALEPNNLDQQIWILRKALSDPRCNSEYIETVPREGYRFVAQVESLWESESEWLAMRGEIEDFLGDPAKEKLDTVFAHIPHSELLDQEIPQSVSEQDVREFREDLVYFDSVLDEFEELATRYEEGLITDAGFLAGMTRVWLELNARSLGSIAKSIGQRRIGIKRVLNLFNLVNSAPRTDERIPPPKSLNEVLAYMENRRRLIRRIADMSDGEVRTLLGLSPEQQVRIFSALDHEFKASMKRPADRADRSLSQEPTGNIRSKNSSGCSRLEVPGLRELQRVDA
jgi:hypothetical protein